MSPRPPLARRVSGRGYRRPFRKTRSGQGAGPRGESARADFGVVQAVLAARAWGDHWSSRLLASYLRREGVSVSHVFVADLWRDNGVRPAPRPALLRAWLTAKNEQGLALAGFLTFADRPKADAGTAIASLNGWRCRRRSSPGTAVWWRPRCARRSGSTARGCSAVPRSSRSTTITSKRRS